MLTQSWPLIGGEQHSEPPIGQNARARGHLNRKINDPKCLDGHLLKMGNIIICEKGLKCFGPDKGDYHYPD